MSTFEPHNELEFALLKAQTGHVALTTFLETFLRSDVAIPSSEEVLPDGNGMSPTFFDKNGTQMVAVFTGLDRAKKATNLAPYCIVMKGRDLLCRMPFEYGLVVNPGYDVGFDITPDGIKLILRDFPQ